MNKPDTKVLFLRIPERLHERLDLMAGVDGISVNKLCIQLLTKDAKLSKEQRDLILRQCESGAGEASKDEN